MVADGRYIGSKRHISVRQLGAGHPSAAEQQNVQAYVLLEGRDFKATVLLLAETSAGISHRFCRAAVGGAFCAGKPVSTCCEEDDKTDVGDQYMIDDRVLMDIFRVAGLLIRRISSWLLSRLSLYD